ncbi:VanZ family protein [Prosthecobacter sp.]|jgi:VanZ family protein|uniref:VanZ family protein n=1 Tax=Prosthecobacter sp. TaxID=1965333 RepID=UPI00378314EB
MKPPRFLVLPLFWRMLVVVWAAALWWLSSQSKLPSPAKFEGIDKIQHAIYFAAGGLCFLLGLRLAGLARQTIPAIVLTVLFCSVIGLIDEWHQTFTPGRSGGDVWDWTADTFGGFLGALIALGAGKWLTSAGTTTAAGR